MKSNQGIQSTVAVTSRNAYIFDQLEQDLRTLSIIAIPISLTFYKILSININI